MSDCTKSSFRIDWFDGTLIAENRPSSSSQFADEDQQEAPETPRPQYTEKKPIGFKRLLDISLLKPPILTLEVSHRPGFWNLLDVDLKGDFIVLIVKILASIYYALEPGEKTKIGSLLRTRFRNSNFLVTLKNYLSELPCVKIVEKRMNTYLWDDVESFYTKVLDLCDGVLIFGDNSTEYLEELHDLLEVTEASALGVREEHTETFSKDFTMRLLELKLKVVKLRNREALQVNKMAKTTEIHNQDPNSFKNLKIFPTRDDLLGKTMLAIKPNIINGAYPSVEHYLDVQFKLLREDCFGPLREGICKYMQNPSKRRHENIRVYPKVRIIRTYVSNNKVGYLVDIAWKDRINNGLIDSKRYAYNKQLMFGSLLLFTSNNFETILCATVLDSNLSLLNDGYIAVSFQNPVSKNIFSEPYLMVESEVFFEPYHRVLKVLQNSKFDDLPMRRYIVDVQPETQPPAYLTTETIYTITDMGKTEEIPFSVLDTEQWPTNAFGFDKSQMEAYKFALTREFAVIQGPPGTGKTFIGVKIASTLLSNLSLEGTPMLIICYTNHALDQFLEGILGITNSMIRLGSQSKSKVLEPYSLNNMRMKIKCKYSYLYASKRSELENIFKEMTEVQSEIEKCEKELLSYRSIKPHLKIGDKLYELNSSHEDPILKWLFGHLEEYITAENSTESERKEDDWEKQLDDLNLTEIETCFSEQWAQKEINSMTNSLKYVKDISDEHLEGHKMADKLEIQISKVRQRMKCFKKNIGLCQNENPIDVSTVKDLYSLTQEQRWTVYKSAVGAIKNELMVKMDNLLEQHNKANEELNEVATLIDGEVMRTVRVVGVTTTTAARRHDLMKKLLSPIVIVEEAAEVLEAHIIASLTHRCQHLILIGDHKQLRPTAAHYKLARDYNLEISLFERMIRNGIHAHTLTTQRRMRTQFVKLIVPAIYDQLDCHPSVYGYHDVRGMRDNLYFYAHDVFEDSEGLEDSWSHKNTLEAKWCVALANYLRQMKYTPGEVTILSTYTGQVSLIKQLSKTYDSLRDIKITAVDNYQGEESRIVILSLVRSNRDGKIGFLAAPNRICVALSRAKEGFYIFGNMNALKAASTIWRCINDKLVAQNAIGKKISIRCRTHQENTTDIECIEDFDSCLSGACLKVCEIK